MFKLNSGFRGRLKPGDNIDTYALFTQLNYNPFKKVKLVAGLRLEQMQKYSYEQINYLDTLKFEDTYDYDKIEVIPRLAIIYSINKNNILKFLYGKAISHPSLYQNFLHVYHNVP